ncbi:glycerophosphodiester phosphodiesterase [Cellulosimicrobium cellulans]|uniref:glycerophosphodiester phosphodiesterase n=1 Tax=Cellulosimicrobium cellulans TaxID=1710 RepID=UPI00196604F5|nr:glycerophosphodiester phosphodiesterase family protein [Cellulosimicrobium cellulans]MBN0039320.1 glycerophosphodiester phosphodiesterase [Cellulosimicrobium cellulans]
MPPPSPGRSPGRPTTSPSSLLRPAADRRGRPLVVGHRGNSSVAPQNTLAAFEAAWRAGADAIELDVHLTADRQVVVLHDDVVDETTDGTGRVDGLTLAEVRALDAGSSFSRAFAGQRVPTFAEVTRLVVERPGLDVLVELKGVWTVEDVLLVTRQVDDAGLADRVLVQSFWPPTVAALRDAAGHLDRALLLALHPDSLAELVEVCAELGVVACNPEVALLAHEPGLVETLHGAGLRVHVWTANTTDEWDDLVIQGVDAIMTDRPDRLVGWLDARFDGWSARRRPSVDG